MNWILWVLGMLFVAYALRELLLELILTLLGIADTADALKPTRGERIADVVRRVSAYLIGWAMLLAGVVAIILALTEPPRTSMLVRISIGVGGLLVSMAGARLGMGATVPRKVRRR